MERFRKIRSTFFQQLAAISSKKNVLAGFLLGIIIVLKQSVQYSHFVGKHTVNIAEPFLVTLTGQGDALLVMIGFIIVVADAPFINEGSFFLIHRIGRKAWYASMWIYITVMGILYQGVLFGASVLPFITKGYMENTWSQTFYLLAQVNGITKKMTIYHIGPQNSDMLGFSPYEALLHTFLCVVLYSVGLAAILFVFNMLLSKHTFGTIGVGLVHMLGMFLYSQPIFGRVLTKWSLFRNAFFPMGYHPDQSNLLFTYSYLALLVVVIYMVGVDLLPYTSFVLKAGKENE